MLDAAVGTLRCGGPPAFAPVVSLLVMATLSPLGSDVDGFDLFQNPITTASNRTPTIAAIAISKKGRQRVAPAFRTPVIGY